MTPDRTGTEKSAVARAVTALGPETIGPLLTRLRVGRGLTQLQVAERLCGLSGHPTVSRHEVSRWEREERVPGPMWLPWLAAVLSVPLEELEAAVAHARPDVDRAAVPGIKRAVEQPQVWRMPTADQLLAVLEIGRVDVLGLAHAWLVGPLELPDLESGNPARRGVRPGDGEVQERIAKLEARLHVLRRQDDLAGGRGLARAVDRELRWAIAATRIVSSGEQRRGVLRTVAGYAQLAGWVRADTGQDDAARRAYRVALQAAAVAGDRDLAGYVLASLSHLSLVTDTNEALLLAQSGQAGVRDGGSLLTRTLLLHRVALAAARVGERRTAEVALGEAEQLAERAEPQPEPPWLYWLDRDELSAMTGRCLLALGRPLRAVRLLSRPRDNAGPRTTALYGAWLARSYVELGEVDEACRVAGRALADAAASGSVRAADALRHLQPMLVRYGRVKAVREYEQLVREQGARLLGRGNPGRGGAGDDNRRRRGRGEENRVPNGVVRQGEAELGSKAETEPKHAVPVKAAQTRKVGTSANLQPAQGSAASASASNGAARVAMGIRYTKGQ
jgi:transcriptional regulator with XRE-family HTH domain